MEIAQGRYRKFSLLVIRYAKAARVNKLTGNNLKQGLRVKNGFTHSEKLLGRSPKWSATSSDLLPSQLIKKHKTITNNKNRKSGPHSPHLHLWTVETVHTCTNTDSTHALTAGPALEGAITARNFKGFL